MESRAKKGATRPRARKRRVDTVKVGLFVPCFVDQFFPEAGRAVVSILEERGIEVEFPEGQTCCGQPAWNLGLRKEARALATRFEHIFSDYEHVVAPSASCVAMVRSHYPEALPPEASAEPGAFKRVFEICTFLWEILGERKVEGSFPHRVGLHEGCHGLRELGQGHASERVHDTSPDPIRSLLGSIEGLELVALSRPDECCGFGGTFAWSEAEVSTRMGEDRLADHAQAGAQVLASADPSCLVHLWGLSQRREKPLATMHVAEILAGYEPRWP